MFSHFFSRKCGCILIVSSFVSLFTLGALSSVSADAKNENNHGGGRVYMIDQKVTYVMRDGYKNSGKPNDFCFRWFL